MKRFGSFCRHAVGLSLVLATFLSTTQVASAQPFANDKYGQQDKFRQLEEILPTPNGYRNAAGEPGPEYWQQTADYVIAVHLDDTKQHITGHEEITYHNHSPHTLRYLWLQIDANLFSPDADSAKLRSFSPSGRISTASMKRLKARLAFDGGAEITRVADHAGHDLEFTIVKTMMRVDLPKPLAPGADFKFEVDWNYQVNNSAIAGGRTGCEYFEEDDNFIYEIAQWFPRMVAFTDATGWQHKQFLGSGEFTLELGDYLVRITAPSDHVVAATGVLQNSGEVLTEQQQKRWEKSKTASRPMFVVTPEEAAENQKEKAEGEKTWVFYAENVRDFAWASSRKFIWDAQGHDVEGNEVMAMSFYPNEAEPLWSKYSTHSIIHTLNIYSRYTFAYPYPTAISVNGPVYGMEYPMICFNGPRPQKDGTYSARTKYGLISVVIHEVGHNYFPMIVNTDERQWTWMDEGLNTFLQYLAEQEWEDDYPSRRGNPEAIAGYMSSSSQVPIMTNSESVLQLGNNAYAKPATALNILRETVLGRELFDFAFKEYARRWKFKRPMPADFFRTMEDASGVDLDWFWRGWFYTTEHCDLAIEDVTWSMPTDGDPDKEADRKREERDSQTPTLSKIRNADLPKRANKFTELKDFYNSYDELEVTPEKRKAFEKAMEGLTDEERELINSKENFYTVKIKNEGGLVMPVILKMYYADGSDEIVRTPVETFARNNLSTSVTVMSEKELVSVELDPHRETADANRDNNYFPPKLEPSRFQIYNGGASGRPTGGDNPMKAARKREEAAKKRREEAAKKAAEEKKSSEKADDSVEDKDAAGEAEKATATATASDKAESSKAKSEAKEKAHHGDAKEKKEAGKRKSPPKKRGKKKRSADEAA
ncbi:MAG: M1 family aminopeptidase [Planctomycetota bacterium]